MTATMGFKVRTTSESHTAGHELVYVDGESVAVVNRFLDALRVRGLAPCTIRAYAFDLLVLYRWLASTGKTLHGLREADIFSTSQVAPPPCVAPDEELYITTITIDGNGKPVIHYQDPNQPADVTGYNVYRAAAPTGPWVLLGSNVVDMDEGTANIQYVDQTGDAGGPWYYEVAAHNSICPAEGPW